jgi:hypothetical protein
MPDDVVEVEGIRILNVQRHRQPFTRLLVRHGVRGDLLDAGQAGRMRGGMQCA